MCKIVLETPFREIVLPSPNKVKDRVAHIYRKNSDQHTNSNMFYLVTLHRKHKLEDHI